MLVLLEAAARVGTRTESRALPPDILRFTLEYPLVPDPEAERERLEELLGGTGFDLFPYSAEDPGLLILQFADVRREQSADTLFAAADALVDALGLVSATPDVDPPYADLETRDATTEALGEVIWSLCRSKAPAPADPGWARRLVRADAAQAAFGVTGAGIRIGQPDTGVAEHDELDQGLDLASGYDFVADRPDPTDPLLRSMGSPGHGTGTSSLVISRPQHKVTGTAPGATLVPIRCLDSVIIGGGTAVAKAIDHAREQGCRIVTMSLGGPISGAALRRAIVRAVRADMIVMAAAGNCVGMVTYPAWDRNVIAVAGVNEHGRRWKGSCHGPEVDIAAPGENLHVARRDAVPKGHRPTPAERAKVVPDGQGTSFAVATTAGVAALWLERWGFAAVRAEARRRGNRPVQDLFRAALQATAQCPPGWDTRDMGAGIVDAHALLSLPLAEIPLDAPVAPEAGPALALRGSAGDVARHATEAEFLIFDRRLRGDPGRAATLETPVAPEPSPRLARLIDLPEAGAAMPAPAAIIAPATPPVPLTDALKRLGASRGAGLESAASVSAEEALARIRTEGPDSILSAAEGVMQAQRARSDRVDGGLQEEALKRIERALVAVTAEDAALPDEGEHRFALEALVRLTGRPALRVTGEDLELATDPNIGEWAGTLIPNRLRWRPKVDAVGRIDVRDHRGLWVHAGTGFLLPEGRVMTNRHVLEAFADPMPAAPGRQEFRMTRRASIIFDPEARDEATRFEITGILTAGGNRIGRTVDLGKLDAAILAVEPANGTGPLPEPIAPDYASTRPGEGVENILVVGYPARPGASQAPSGPDEVMPFWDRVGELFGDRFGVKYISPGTLMSRPGAVAGDARGWAFSHDCTTFAGNSGSAILSLHGGMALCGLHFGGSVLTMNLAHDLGIVRATGDGVFDTGRI